MENKCNHMPKAVNQFVFRPGSKIDLLCKKNGHMALWTKEQKEEFIELLKNSANDIFPI